MLYVPSTPGDMDISFSVFDSDHMRNHVVMGNVVGTLVKYSGIGRYENYLAERWEVSSDKKKWKFEIKNNLFDENNEEITAEKIVKNLKRLLRLYKQAYTPPCFESLVGWELFHNDKNDLAGLYVEGNNVHMDFKEIPSGLLEFLSMSYYGYYSEKDFVGDQWKNKNSIISTGQYRVQKNQNGEIELYSRKDKSPLGQRGLDRIVIKYLSDDELRKESGPFIADVSERIAQKEMSDRIITRSTPSILRGVILSPYKDGFKNIEDRELFFKTFNEIKEDKLGFQDEKAKTFYKIFEDFSRTAISTQAKVRKKSTRRKMSVYYREDGNVYVDEILKILKMTAETLEIDLNFKTQKDLKDKNRMDVYSNKEFDIRIFAVDIGGAPENWVVEMMFVSKLGVSFPDKDGVWRKLVDDYKDGNFKTELEYWKKFNENIENEKTVIPVLHNSLKWMISKKIKSDLFSQTMSLPRFDEIVLN